MSKTHPFLRHPIFHLLLLALLLFWLAWVSISPLTFFSNDIGLRYLQIQALIAQNWQSTAVPYPAAAIDPTFQHVPYYYAYSLVDGRLFLNISLLFPLVGSWLFVLLGKAGLVATPVIGSLLAAWGIYLLAQMSGLKRPYLTLWGAVFTTPLLFYTLHLWDHSLGTGLAVLGLALAAQGWQTNRRVWIIAGGVLLGLSPHTRPELYFFVLAMGITWSVITWPRWRSALWLPGGGLAGFIPMTVLQTSFVGHPLGFPIAAAIFDFGTPEAYPVAPYSEVVITPAIKMGRLLFHIESRDPLTFGAAMLVMVGAVLIVFALRVPRYRKTTVLWTGTTFMFIGYLMWGTVALQTPITGLVSTFPLIGLSLVFVDKQNTSAQSWFVYRLLFFTTFLFLAGMILIWPSFGGTQWGARYLLPAYPLLLYLALYAVSRYAERVKRPYAATLRKATALLLLTSVVIQGLGVYLIMRTMAEQVDVRQQIASLPANLILTNHPFLPSFMTSLEEKTFLFVADEDDLETIIPRIVDQEIRHIAVLPLESGQFILPHQIDQIKIVQIETAVYQLEPVQN